MSVENILSTFTDSQLRELHQKISEKFDIWEHNVDLKFIGLWISEWDGIGDIEKSYNNVARDYDSLWIECEKNCMRCGSNIRCKKSIINYNCALCEKCIQTKPTTPDFNRWEKRFDKK